MDNFLKKMGELYEIVVFTASLSKVRSPEVMFGRVLTPSSTPIRFSINSTCIGWCPIDYSEKAVTITRGITSRSVPFLYRRHLIYALKLFDPQDLSQLGRPMSDTIILDNSPASYIFHPNNAVPVSSWFNDPHDTELTDLCPFLTDLRTVDDVRAVLDGGL